MNRNTIQYVKNSYTPTEGKEGEESGRSRESRRRRRLKHSMHIFSKDLLEKEKKENREEG
jgi:hypothetical protein